GRGRHNAARRFPGSSRCGRAASAPRDPCPMNQIRTFLLIAWLMVAFLLWQEWGKEKVAAAQPTAAVPAAAQGEVPAAVATPLAAPAAGAIAQASAVATAPTLRLRNDVLALELNGRDVTRAELLHY